MLPRTADVPYPKKVDQPERNPGGSLTQNGLLARIPNVWSVLVQFSSDSKQLVEELG